jgi:dTDP-6-deoxy-L-talose 4-dehydrogenase (NAD+)
MKKVLVTGATGFIGNYVIGELLSQSCSVIASSANEAGARQKYWYKDSTYIPFDLRLFRPTTNYYEFFQRPDLMIHLGWEGLPNYKSSFHTEENLPRHRKFLKNLLENGLPDLTVTGTCLEYGMGEGALNEEMLPRPSISYAVAKDELRKFVAELKKDHSFSFKWVRLFYMYGEGQNPNSLLSQLDRAIKNGETVFNMSGGEQLRDYLPVESVAEYIVKIALQNRVSGIINCCSGKPVKIKEFVKDYLQRKNQHISLNLGYYPYPDYEPMHFWGDDNKLKSILNDE